jgi:hypothetical protein
MHQTGYLSDAILRLGCDIEELPMINHLSFFIWHSAGSDSNHHWAIQVHVDKEALDFRRMGLCLQSMLPRSWSQVSTSTPSPAHRCQWGFSFPMNTFA